MLTSSRYRDIIDLDNKEKVILIPVLAQFYGIAIRMYFLQNEHNPPHIHAIYNDNAAAIDFMTGELLDDYLPAKALELVREWIDLHKDSLKEIWETQEFKKLPPL